MKKKKLNVKKLLNEAYFGPSEWMLDNITYNDRTSNPKTLLEFLTRLDHLSELKEPTADEQLELDILIKLSADLDEDECEELLGNNDDVVQQNFIENLARQSALETLCNGQLSIDTMALTCKLNPNDFILVAKRSQDIINAIRELVIQGETLSEDVAGA